MRVKFFNPPINLPESKPLYSYYTDLYNRFKKMVVIVDENPDVVIYGLNFLTTERPYKFASNSKKPVPKICFVQKIGVDWERKQKFLSKCDVVLSSIPKLPIKHTLFKHGFNNSIFTTNPTRPPEKVFDFGFTGALHDAKHYPEGTFRYPDLRKNIQELARTQQDLSLFINGSDDVKKRIPSYERYYETLCRSKIWMSTTGPNGDIGPRYYEIMASGTLLFCDEPPEEYRRTFRDGQNCVYFTPENFIEKLRLYVEDEQERNRIISHAVRGSTNHTWTARAWELLAICSKLCG